MKIELINETESTNDYIKRYLDGGEDVIVCAARQTCGRGTKGRAFLSEAGGVYLSALTFYKGVPASDAFCVMTHASVSVCRTAEAFGISPVIKWPNDVYVKGKKLSGILIENCCSEGLLKYSIVGIGLNAENDLSSLGGIAVSLSAAAGRKISVAEARDKLIENYRTADTFSDYLRYAVTQCTVRILENGREYTAFINRILKDGRLEIQTEEGVRALSAAEITVRL